MHEKGERIPKEVYLVPELLKMTGMSDEQRSNFNIQKDLS